MMLQSLRTINDVNRNSSVDVFRSFAIISVVLVHFRGFLPLGFVGVDLFFVISGLLVGSLLIKQFQEHGNINFFRFFIQRGFKIWPSYYIYILITTLISLYVNPEKPFYFSDLYKYLFFYENYTGTSTIIWSLCVEEHFYILLPVLFLIVINFISNNYKLKCLFLFVGLTIIAGILFKFASYLFTNGKDTYSATHNRLDALAWGVMLGLLITYCKEQIQKISLFLFAFGSIFLVVSLTLYGKWFMYDKLLFHSIVPFAFFLMIAALYHVNLFWLKPMRFIAYYSYNWYLWHSIVSTMILKYFSVSFIGILLYLVISFAIAMIATICIEEPLLRKRGFILQKIFSAK